MAVAVAEPLVRMSPEEFRAFYEARPDEERWELLGGVPVMMMTPVRVIHNVIGGNLERLLNDALLPREPAWVAVQRPGADIAVDDAYRPEPDVVVIDADYPPDLRYIERAYLIAEIVSSSDRKHVPGTRRPRIEAKRDIYRRHAPCQAILTVEQDRIEVVLATRGPSDWTETSLRGPDAELALPGFGLRCRLAVLYARTPLVPRRGR